MQKFMESLGDYLDYLDAKSDILPALFLIGLIILITITLVVIGGLIIINFGAIGLFVTVFSVWFMVYVFMFYKFYKYRKEKRAKT